MNGKSSSYKTLTTLILASVCLVVKAGETKRPNVIIAMADDMGWQDLSSYGNDRVDTPNIGDLKGGKTDLHEGGIRVAGLVRWPGLIQPGSESGVLSHSTDLLPTVCSTVRIPLPKDDAFDGIDLLPLLIGQVDSLNRGTVFWQINLYRNLQRHTPKPKPFATEIARKGKWKLLAKDDEPVELFNIESDLCEQYDLVKEKPEIASDLKQELQAWLAEPRRQYGNIPE
jgi:arylsulfatase A